MLTARGKLAETLEPYRSQAIADGVGCSRQQAHSWRTGASLPDVRYLPGLARFLKMDLAALTEMVADETTQRAAVA